jgi:LPS sulfotransferase NodH
MAFGAFKAAARLATARINCFDPRTFDQNRYDQIMAKPEPANIYAIFFTPRSGSTRVMDLIAEAGLSNPPREYFNEHTLPRIARNHGARSLTDYVSLVPRKQQVGGHFGFEATYKHIRFAFGTASRFDRMLRPNHSVWLIREDIVAQAVSVSRLVQTKVSHTPRSTAEAQGLAEQAFEYREQQIERAIGQILRLEAGMEKLMSRIGLNPLRLSYETVTTLGADRALKVCADALGLPAPTGSVTETHNKLDSPKALEFAARFRKDHAGGVAQVNHVRAARVQSLYDPTQQV